MRELFTTLELLKFSTPMEHCEEFNGIKNILEYCDKYVQAFSQLRSCEENHTFLDELVRRLQEYLIECNLLYQKEKCVETASSVKLRKVLMFLVLNTDIVYKYNLRNDNNLIHILEICPLMPQCLLIQLVWRLHLDKYFFELLSYSPCWFSSQPFLSIIKSLKCIEDPFEVLDKVHELLKVVFISITRSPRIQTDYDDMKIFYNKHYEYAVSLLHLFYTSNAEKCQNLSEKQYYKYIGFVLMHSLQLLPYMFDVFEQPDLTDASEKVEVFNICPNLPKKVRYSKEELKFVYEYKLKFINAVLIALQNNVAIINDGMFTYWMELNVKDGDNLQKIIGNLAHKVRERMLNSTIFNCGVANHLKSIAIRPQTLQETLANATLGDILSALDNQKMVHHVKKVWLSELLCRHKDLSNKKCLEAIKQNITLINVADCQKILDFIKFVLQTSNKNNTQTFSTEEGENCYMDATFEDYSDLIKIILNTIQKFSVCDILQLLTYQSKLFGFNNSLFAQVDTLQRINEFLNKFNTESETFNYQQYLVIAFENPELVWQKFFDCANHNKVHTTNYCGAVKLTLPISNYYYLTHLTDALQRGDILEQLYFPDLLCELYLQLYYPDQKPAFLKEIIYKYVNYYLDSKRFECIIPLMRCLNLIESFGETQSHKPLNFGELTSPVLLMTAQIMDKARWDLITYTNVREELVRECIEFIQVTSKKFLPKATVKDRSWITNFIKCSSKPLTQYYFQKYALPSEQLSKSFDQFLTPEEKQDQSDMEILLINYIRCTMKETEWLMRCERFLPHISDVMLILSKIIKGTENINSINNYRQCLANYANIMRKILIPKILNDAKKIEKCLIKTLKILAALPDFIYEETLLSFEPLLINLIKMHGSPIEDTFANAIQKYLEEMKQCHGKEVLVEKFQIITNELKLVN